MRKDLSTIIIVPAKISTIQKKCSPLTILRMRKKLPKIKSKIFTGMSIYPNPHNAIFHKLQLPSGPLTHSFHHHEPPTLPPLPVPADGIKPPPRLPLPLLLFILRLSGMHAISQ